MKISSNNLDKIVVIGDKILVRPIDDPGKTANGLYLPPGVSEKEKVQTGYILKTGPGYPIPTYSSEEDEPWKEKKNSVKFIPLQAKTGDLAVFLRRDAIEIEFEKEKFLIIQQSSVLLVYREDFLSSIKNL